MRVCAKCHELKSLGDFYRDARKASGRRSYCKQCCQSQEARARRKAYYWLNRESSIAKAAEWQKENRERRRKTCLDWYYRHRDTEKQNARAHEWRVRNPEKAALSSAKRTLAQTYGVRSREIPEDLALAKAAQLTVLREVRKRES